MNWESFDRATAPTSEEAQFNYMKLHASPTDAVIEYEEMCDPEARQSSRIESPLGRLSLLSPTDATLEYVEPTEGATFASTHTTLLPTAHDYPQQRTYE